MFSALPMAAPVSNSRKFQPHSLPMSRTRCTLEEQLNNHMSQVTENYWLRFIEIYLKWSDCFWVSRFLKNTVQTVPNNIYIETTVSTFLPWCAAIWFSKNSESVELFIKCNFEYLIFKLNQVDKLTSLYHHVLFQVDKLTQEYDTLIKETNSNIAPSVEWHQRKKLVHFQ